MKRLLLPALMFAGFGASSQLVIDGAVFFIGENAVVTVQGNVQSNVSIQAGGAGATLGKLQMKGSGLQQLNMTNISNTIPRLEIDNLSHVQLTSGARVGNLEFTNGKLQLGANDLVYTGAITGAATGKFVETDGAGFLRDSVGVGALVNVVLPVGNGSDYTPVTIASSSNNSGVNATVGARSTGLAVPTPTRHPRTEAYLSTTWAYQTQNLAGTGTLTGTGTYVPADAVLVPSTNLTATDITGFSLVGSTWSLTGTSKAANSVGATLPGTSGFLYGMNKFLLASPKAYLEGAYFAPTTAGLMNDLLRNSTGIYAANTFPASNLIPLLDPYRIAAYSSNFIQANNPVSETIASSVLNDLPNSENQIVDWVFVELRTITNATLAPVTQTRSALLQRDGDVVDIDGTSALYFKNADAGNFAVSVRHRNHLGMSSNPATPIALNLVTANIDFSNTAATASLYGVAGTNYVQMGGALRNALWSGNASSNTQTRYSGTGNDKDFILGIGLGSVSSTILNNVYNASDINMNRAVRYSGISNDKDYLLATPLISIGTTIRSQVLPN